MITQVLLMPALLTLASFSAVSVVPLPAQPEAPALLLNEVVFDAIGSNGAEWLEVYSTQAMNLQGWTIEDNHGTVLGTLPSMDLPAYSVVVVVIGGDAQANYDSDATDRSASLMLGLPPGDYLGNQSGGVRLRDPSQRIADEVYWGLGSAPAGSGTNEVFDLSFATGRPMGEGGSLGRPADPLTDYSGDLSDWERTGGVNTSRVTPGARNGLEVIGMTGLKIWAQTGVNQVINHYSSMVEPNWFSIIGSDIRGSTYNYQPNSFTVTSEHTFFVSVRGIPTSLTGWITAVYSWDETPGAVAYQLTSTGTLSSDAGYGFSIDHSEAFSGFNTNEIVVTTSTDVVYTEAGVDYPFSVSGTNTSTWIGEGQTQTVDVRTCLDYGGAGPKVATATTTRTRLGPGNYSSTFALVRPVKVGPPSLEDAGFEILFDEESFFIDTTTTINGRGEVVDGVISRYDRLVNGYLDVELQSGAMGSFGFVQTSGSAYALPQEFAYQLDLPVSKKGTPSVISGSVTGSKFLFEGKLISRSLATVRVNDTTVLSQRFFVDPVVQGQQIIFIPDNRGTVIINQPDNPPPMQPQSPLPQPPAADDGDKTGDGGYWQAAADCSSSGADIGGGVGAVGGGIAGGIVGAPSGPGIVVGVVAGAGVGYGAGQAVGAGVGFLGCSISYGWSLFWD